MSAQKAPQLRAPDWQSLGATAAPELACRAAILVDVGARTILFALNPDLVVPPASLTKLVTMNAALEAVNAGEISLDRHITPAPDAWAESLPPGSSLMFLGPDQRLTVRELLTGLVVASGNDAAIEVADLLDGGVPAFAQRMNRSVEDLGLVDLHFVEPSGLSAENSITARDFARFILAHIDRFPWALDEFYSVPSMTYPAQANRVGPAAREPITQRNRNSLLGSYDGVDGLKTGFIDESGYHLAVTAERDGRRLLAIVLGVDAPNSAIGGAERAREGQALLDYGFSAFDELTVGRPALPDVTVFGGDRRTVAATAPEGFVIVVPHGQASQIDGQIDAVTELVAPFPAAEIGTIAVTYKGTTIARAPITVDAVRRGPFIRRAWDGLRLALRSVFSQKPAPVTGAALTPAGR